MASQCLATFNKTHKWDQGPKCFSVLSKTTAKSRCLQTSKNRVSIYNILPPSNYSVSCFQLKDLLRWTTKNLRCFFPPFACPTSPWIHKLSSSKMLWQSSTCLKICHSIKSIQNAAFVWKATVLAFQSTSASSQGSSSPTCYLSFWACHWLLWHSDGTESWWTRNV